MGRAYSPQSGAWIHFPARWTGQVWERAVSPEERQRNKSISLLFPALTMGPWIHGGGSGCLIPLYGHIVRESMIFVRRNLAQQRGPHTRYLFVAWHGRVTTYSHKNFQCETPKSIANDSIGDSCFPSFYTMNESTSDLLYADYLAALRFYVEQGTQVTLQAAQSLGRTAVKYGFETLKLANIHNQALALLLAVEPTLVRKQELTKMAAIFFAEVIMPIEGTHQAARADNEDLEQLNSSLSQRTTDLAVSNRELKVQIDERISAEAALKISEHSSSQLLKDSQLLEQQLKEMTQKIISSTEHERHVMSLRLNNEIAQTLLGINFRMSSLKNEIATNQVNHHHEIAMIQQLVEESVEMIKRLAYEYSDNHN